jgi:hypothetical protein
MESSEFQNRLKGLDNDKLIDVVKNYRQYGYADDIRSSALTILHDRGINKDDLQLTGNYENRTYDHANDIFSSFKRNSKIAFIFYGLLILIKFVAPHTGINSNSFNAFTFFGFIFCFVIYLLFILRSFLNQSEFYKLSGGEFGSEGAFMYLFFGMPFYVVMYFVFQKQMKEKMASIR